MSSEKMIVRLHTLDGDTFEVEKRIALQSELFKEQFRADLDDYTLPYWIKAPIMTKVIEYCKRHVEAAEMAQADPAVYTDDDLEEFDIEFMNVDRKTVGGLVRAACDLKIKSLHRVAMVTLGNMSRSVSLNTSLYFPKSGEPRVRRSPLRYIFRGRPPNPPK